jgi:xanthine dehydrogenase small subunit
MIIFYLNDQRVESTLPPGMTVLDFIRKHQRLKGTKIGCREGDCGACTVLVGGLENDELIYRNMTSCLMPLANAHGKHIVTVEGINSSALTPVQEAIVNHNGTQCGFCTIGFVMSLTGFAINGHGKEKAVASMDGNICRCTGYKSLERAAENIAEKTASRPEASRLKWLVDKGFVPAYFLNIEDNLRSIPKMKPVDGGKVTGGGTDLFVQKPERMVQESFVPLFDNPELNGIEEQGGQCFLGASVTVSDMAESPVLHRIFPDLDQYIKLVSSTPIRNMATLAGNFVNASPIGDMTIFFLALDSSLILKNGSHRRTIKLKDFYKGYKQLDKKPEEIIERIVFDIPEMPYVFNFEKVCKRTHLDIASVNTACLLKFDEKGVITQAHISAGGLAPVPKYLSSTADFLQGKSIDELSPETVNRQLQSEVSPISDVRGSKAYKRLLLRQLVMAHFLKVEPESIVF